MTDRDPDEVTNLSRDGDAPLDWNRPRDLLRAGTPRPGATFYLGTVGPDGRPHSAGTFPVWIDGDLYFTSGPGTRKSRNLAKDPTATLSVSLATIDLILHGEATRITDPALIDRVATKLHSVGWPVTPLDDGFTAPFAAPSAGQPPWHPYIFTFHTAIGVATADPYGATRWHFTR